MGSFTNLIQQLPPNNDGKDFERLSKWILETDPRYKSLVDQVWLWDEWPDKWGPDTGIDIVVRTKENEYWAVQCKAYDPEYSITKSDIDSFVAESARSQFSYRLLIATTDRIGSNARRTIEGVTPHCSTLLRTDLDSLSIDWPNSFDDFASAAPHVPWDPRPHQNEALENIVNGLQTSDRGKVVMPCGSGKTLVALWASERLKSQSVLVLVPSISLMKQTIGEWSANSNEPMTYLAVCSDSQVTAEAGSDSIVSSTSDVPFPVTTDPDHIARYLDSAGKKVVFSTYQSSPSVSEAQRIANSSEFDLVIADEAHRCAGRVTKTFSTVLDNTKIPTSKRIFMTATPRYFTGRVVKEADDEDIEIASMDDPEQFGDTLHTLSFSKAISDDLLCDYQVLVIGVDDETVKAYAENGNFVTLDGDTITDARILASQIGLAKSMKKHDLKRVLTFHNRIKNASEFAGKFLDVIDWMPDEDIPSGLINCDHVSGKMNAGERAAKLNKLRNLDGVDRSLVTNARCLAEGVDVPTLDAVGFIDPKSSQIDIVQAVGRVMRTAEKKTIGTIVIPVFINENDDPDTILNDSAFDTVWQVIKAIRSHDEEIAETLDQLRRESGRTGKNITTADFGDKIIFDLPSKVNADFSNRLSTRIVELTTSSWEYGFGKLMKFFERTGHALVPTPHIEDGFKLGVWVNTRRQDYKRGKLPQEKIDELNDLGFVWDAVQHLWDDGVSHLKRFVEREGHARIPQGYIEDGYSLGYWVSARRKDNNRNKLDQERIGELSDIGFEWDELASRFQEGLSHLKRFVEREGHARVPAGYIEDGYRLGAWVNKRRSGYIKGILTDNQIEDLNDLGFVWDVLEYNFQEGLSHLKRFVEREGHARVPAGYIEDGYRLGTWVNVKRKEYKKGQLIEEREDQLNDLNFVWDPFKAQWGEGISHLERYVEREGHARVPAGYIEDGYRLGTWVNGRRNDYKKGQLTEEREDQLNDLNFVWDPFKAQWDQAISHLKRFIEREGHARVPTEHIENGYKLGGWVHNQRVKYGRSKLPQEQLDELNDLGFVWSATDR